MGENLPPKTIQVDRLLLDPVLDARLDELAGFFVSGMKRKAGYARPKVGFLLSNIRLISIRPSEKTRFYLMLKFLPTGFVVQEDLYFVRRKQGKNSVFMVNFEDWQPLILEGAPQLDVNQRAFYSQWAEVKWSEKGIDVTPTPQPAKFIARIDSKRHKIELTVQQLRKR